MTNKRGSWTGVTGITIAQAGIAWLRRESVKYVATVFHETLRSPTAIHVGRRNGDDIDSDVTCLSGPQAICCPTRHVSPSASHGGFACSEKATSSQYHLSHGNAIRLSLASIGREPPSCAFHPLQSCLASTELGCLLLALSHIACGVGLHCPLRRIMRL